MVLIDTDVLVECFRGSVAANAWLRGLSRETFMIPGVVAMELVMGCRNPAELEQMRKFLAACRIAWPDALESAQAFELLVTHRLTLGIGIPDCMIAAMALAQGLRLYTFDLKHFQGIPGLDVQAPYPRP